MELKKYLTTFYVILGFLIFSIFIIIFKGWFTQRRQGLDLAGGVRLLYLMDFSQYKQNYKDQNQFIQQRNKVIDIVEKNIDARISKLWVSDYNARHVVLWWKDYIEIEIGGIKDVEYAKKLIWKTVQMTFKVPFTGQLTQDIINQRQLLAEKILNLIKTKGLDSVSDYLIPPRAWNINTSPVELSKQDIVKIFGEDITKSLSTGYVYPKLVKTNNSFDIYVYNGKDKDKYQFLKISVMKKPTRVDAKYNGDLLNGERFKMATVSRAPSGESAVNIYFDDKWRDMFCKLTAEYLHQPMAIFIWNRLVTDPVIQTQICGGVAQITWRYTPEQAEKLAEDLNTGAMPVSLKLEQEQKVSPLLWEKAFRNSLIAAWVWVVLIFIMFLVAYGFIYALVTLLSLIIFFLALGWFIKLFDVVLSLSAIWAILLNIGMAVDANVIIYERIREELAAGASWRGAVIKGYERSLAAIRDWNLTTGFIALLLFLVWTNIFKWFGTMMMINIFIVLVVMVPSIPVLLIWFGERFNIKK